MDIYVRYKLNQLFRQSCLAEEVISPGIALSDHDFSNIG